MKTPYIIIYLLSLLSISLVRLSAADIDVRVTGIYKASFYCFFNQKGVTKRESLLDSGATTVKNIKPGEYSLFLGTQGGINKKKWIAVKELIITEEDVKTQKVAVKFTGEHVLKLPLPRKDFWPTEER